MERKKSSMKLKKKMRAAMKNSTERLKDKIAEISKESKKTKIGEKK